MFSYGLVGLPNAGKSTLFNALTHAGAEVESYPFCTIDPNVGVVAVPDDRLEKLGQLLQPEKLTPATIEFVDIAGLVRDASQGEGLGNEFLGHIQQVDAVAHVVRCFEDEDVAHVDGTVDPVKDIDTINSELIARDLGIVDRRHEEVSKAARTGEREAEKRQKILEGLMDVLNAGRFVNEVDLDEDGMRFVRDMGLLTVKPVIYVGNVSEEQLTELAGKKPVNCQGTVGEMARCLQRNGETCTYICARLEEELGELDDPAEARMFLEEMGVGESSIDRLVRLGYDALGLITFYTVKGPETRAWELPEGTPAPVAAGRIHSDMQDGFIKAEVVSWDRLVEAGSFTGARNEGWMRAEGRGYPVKDGDVILFHFRA